MENGTKVWDQDRIELATPGSAVRLASVARHITDCVMFIVLFVTFPCGILGQVWNLIESFPDLCRLSYFKIWKKSGYK